MIETIGVCAGPGTCLGRFEIGKDVLEVSRSGKRLLTILNGRAVMAAKSDKELVEKSAPVMGTIMATLCKTCNIEGVQCRTMDPRYAARLEEAIKTIRENADGVDVSVLSKPGDEEEDSNPKQGYQASKKARTDSKSLQEGLQSYREHLAEVSQNITSLNHASEVLLKTHLAKQMWGSKEVTAVLHDVKSGMAGLDVEAEALEGRMEHSDAGARYVQACMASSREAHAREAISKVLENFAALKTYSSELAQTLHGLYSIDRVFKASTGYPATWFLDSSILMDFEYEYDGLVNNMIRNAGIESSIIEPLLVWKIRTTGE